MLIYLFLAALCLCCFSQVFSSCGKQGLPFAVVSGLLIAVAFPVVLQSLGTWVSVFAACGPSMWCMGLVAPWHVESSQTRDRMSLALAGGFLSAVPPGKSGIVPLFPLSFLKNSLMLIHI